MRRHSIWARGNRLGKPDVSKGLQNLSELACSAKKETNRRDRTYSARKREGGHSQQRTQTGRVLRKKVTKPGLRTQSGEQWSYSTIPARRKEGGLDIRGQRKAICEIWKESAKNLFSVRGRKHGQQEPSTEAKVGASNRPSVGFYSGRMIKGKKNKKGVGGKRPMTGEHSFRARVTST